MASLYARANKKKEKEIAAAVAAGDNEKILALGSRKINCETYNPDPVDWEETNAVYEWEDGWKVCIDETEHDLRANFKGTYVCCAGFMHLRHPLSQETIDKHEARITAEMEGMAALREKNGAEPLDEDTLRENTVARLRREDHTFRTALPGEGIFKFGHFRDPEGRPRSCIVMARVDAIDKTGAFEGWQGHAPYCYSRDLGQTHPIKLPEGNLYHVLEIRIGTGSTCPQEVMERAMEWYANSTGEWDQAAFENYQPEYYIGIFGGHPDNDKLAAYKGK